jgi:hypothetical protein
MQNEDRYSLKPKSPNLIPYLTFDCKISWICLAMENKPGFHITIIVFLLTIKLFLVSIHRFLLPLQIISTYLA